MSSITKANFTLVAKHKPALDYHPRNLYALIDLKYV